MNSSVGSAPGGESIGCGNDLRASRICAVRGGELMAYARIVFDPNIMGGQACIRGTRIPIAAIVRCVASGMNHTEIVEAYPDLESEDITEALQFAADMSEDRFVPLVAGS